MKYTLTSILLICMVTFCALTANAQITTSSQWTWVSGDNSTNQLGVYGTKGTAAASNKLGARYGSVRWTDASGDVWLFGGNGYAASGRGNLSDLWKYNTSTGQWTWVSGDNTVNQFGVYGTKGTAAASNKPGARNLSVSWSDASGNLWLFGGQGYAASGSLGSLNDLWKYNTSTGQWTWVSGDTTGNQSGVYGTQGTAAASNKPGARNASVSWTDASGNLWLFGGIGYAASGSFGSLNDLWKYNTSSGQWTWMNGDNAVDQSGVYGTKGTAAATNKPGARQNSVSWTDANGNVWLFGGFGYAVSGNGQLNDLWKYNTSTGQWIWVSGDNTTNQFGDYGTQGTAAASNKPGARNASVSWTDASGNLWLFGGFGYAVSGNGQLNDLWKYNTSTGQWTWVKGDNTINQFGVYGTIGTAAASNKLGARYISVGWSDATGNLWLFGGYGYASSGGVGYLNDLWKIGTSCTATASTFTTSACGSYTWAAKGNKVYTASNNTDTIKLVNAAGCDSIVTLNLIINAATTSTNSAKACGSYLWNGTTYTTSGSYTKTFTGVNSVGCDSVATLNLTITNSLNKTSLSCLSPAKAAYSLRQLSSSYSSSAILVRRSSNGATQAIGFVNGNLDTATLKAFVGTGNGFITTWYDQTGNGNDITQTNTGNQPIIMVAGVINYLNGKGKPALKFDGGSTWMNVPFSSSAINAEGSISAVHSQPALQNGFNSIFAWSSGIGGQKSVGYGAFDGNGLFGLYATFGSQQYLSFGPVVANTTYVANATWTGSGTSVTESRNGTVVTGNIGSVFTTNVSAGFLGIAVSNGAYFNGTLPEAIVFSTALSTSDRIALETNQTAYYNSTDASLSGIGLNEGTLSPTFASSTIAYTARVSNATSSITVTPTLSNTYATVTVNGVAVTGGTASSDIPLSVGSTAILIVGTSSDGTTTKTYTITATRAASTDATLSALSTTAGSISPTFASGTIAYTASVANATTSITVTPTVNQANATVKVNNLTVTSGSASGVITLTVGSNPILIVVTAQDGTTTKTYTINVTRAAIPPGNALNFDGVNDYVKVANNAALETSTGTVELWARPTWTSGSRGSNPSMIGMRSGSGTRYSWHIRNGYNALDLFNGTTVGSINYSFVQNTWYHFAFVYSQTNCIVYINGSNVGTTGIGFSSATGQPLCIGISGDAITSEAFLGNIDEVRIWNTQRTALEISANMNVDIVPSSGGLVAYYRFNQGVASSTNTGLTTLYDQTNNANNGTLTNFALTGSSSNWVESYAMVVPTATAATSIGSAGITANWTAPIVGTVTNYLLDVSTSSTFGSFISGYNSLSVSGTSQAITGLTAGTTYYYRVRADKTSVTGQGGYSSSITAITLFTDATLSALSTIAGSISPTFAASTTAYTASVPNATSSITITPTVNQANSTVTVNGISVTSGSASGAITLTVGSNAIAIVVTAQDGSTTKTYTITVTRACATNTAGTASATPTVCINTALTNITHTTTGATGIGSATGLPAGISAAWASNTITISGTPTASGTYNYSISLTGGCGTVSGTGTITVTANNTISLSSAVSTDAQTINANNAITAITYGTTNATGASITGLPTGVTGNWSSNVFTISGTPSVSGTFNYTITLTGGCGTVTKTGSISALNPATLGSYSATSVIAGQNTSITPSAAPTNAASIVAYTNTNFSGVFTVNPTTGVVTVTDAKQAGSYTVTLKATSSGGATATTTFTLTVTNPACSQGLFSGSANVSVGANPSSVAVGDFNGDGKQDIAVANYSDNTVSIHLGDGTGSFIGNTEVAVGSNPYSVAIGDFNGDGKQDIATSNALSDNVSIRLGNGTGGFSGSTSVSVGNNPYSVAMGDFNGDGKQDIAVANYSDNTVSIRLGDGTGSFIGNTDVFVGFGSNPNSVAVGDFNGDGKQDIVTANSSSENVSINLGDGNGGFSGSTSFSVSVGANPTSVAVGDFNGDGKQDIVTANSSSKNVSILLGDGNGYFNASIEVSLGFYPYSVAVGDFNGDGKQDIVTANFTNNTASFRLGDGTGGFSGNTDVYLGYYNSPYSVAVGDFNGDGKQDIATANFIGSTASILLGGGAVINVMGNSNTITNGSTSTTQTNATNFGSTCISSNVTKTYTIQNTGTTALTISTGGITRSGIDASLFTVGGITLPATIAANSSATFTVSFSPTTSGAKSAQINIANNTCDIPTSYAIGATVTASNTASTASSTPTVCINTALTNITHTTTGATGIGSATGLPAGVSAAWASNTITISGTPTVAGTFNYSIPLTGGCGTVNATGTITVWAINTAGSASSTPTVCINTDLSNITHITTGATGIGVATGLPAGVIAIWESNTIYVFSQLGEGKSKSVNSGIFNYSIPLIGGCGNMNATGTITVTGNNISLSSAVNTDAQTVNKNKAVTAITYNTTLATGASISGLPAGISGNWSSNVFTISGTPREIGTFNYTITLTGGCGNVTKTGSIIVVRSSDATLSSLTITVGSITPSFASGTIAYTATVPNSTTSITVTPTINQENASLKVNGVYVFYRDVYVEFTNGVNSTPIVIEVTAQDGTTKTYTLTVNREASSDATLSSITTTAGSISPTFASGTIAYTASVANATTSFTVTPTVNQAYATVTVNGVTAESGSPSDAITLTVGSNPIPIVVTAQDGTTKTYTITVTRASGVANYVWTGNVSSDWSNAENWSNSVLPSKGNSVTIPAVAISPALSESVDVNNINLASGAVLSLNGHDLYISGDVLGTGKLKGSSTSSLYLYSGNNNTIYFASATASDSLLANLNIYGTGAITLGSGVGITEILNVYRGTLITNNHLTLKSTSVANSAVVDKVGGSIVGNVTVERYIPQGLRLYRDMGASVANAGSVYNNWQEGGNNSNGYGIHITGSKGASTGIDPVTGLDYTNTGYHSLFKYSNNRWDSVLNTRTTNLDPYQGYRVFVRGNRAVNLFSNTGATSLFTPVTLRNTGALIQGNVTFTTSGTNGSYSSAYGLTNGVGAYSFLANPYVCPTNWNAIYASSSNITPSYWYADPTFLSNGYTTYVTYNGYSQTSSNPSNSNVGQYLQSGQAFFIQNDNSGQAPQLVITESSKVPTATKTAIFGTAMPNRIIIGLNKANKNVDGAVAVFANNYSNVIGKEDSRKFSNPGENISLLAANKDLSIDGLALPSTNVTIPIHLYSLKSATTYQLNIDMTDYAANGMNAFLIDGKLITQTLLTGNNAYAFTTTSDTASYNSRFSIVFKPTTLPIEAITLAATFESSSKSVKLGWLVKGTQQAVTYTVEHSTDGKTYQELAIIAQTSSFDYHYTDQKSVEGINYYRIKATVSNGQILYSNTTSVQHNEGSQFIVFPSPVTQGVNIKLHLHNLPVDKYTAILSNTLGQELRRKSIQNQGRDVIEVMSTATLSAGVYTITLTSGSGKKIVEQVVIK